MAIYLVVIMSCTFTESFLPGCVLHSMKLVRVHRCLAKSTERKLASKCNSLATRPGNPKIFQNQLSLIQLNPSCKPITASKLSSSPSIRQWASRASLSTSFVRSKCQSCKKNGSLWAALFPCRFALCSSKDLNSNSRVTNNSPMFRCSPFSSLTTGPSHTIPISKLLPSHRGTVPTSQSW